MATKTVKTTKASGLSIVRNGNILTCSWKIPSAKFEAGQQCSYRVKVAGAWSKWVSLTCTTATTSKAVTITPSLYYPTTKKELHAVEFAIRGCTKNTKKITYQWSDWVLKTFDIVKPDAASVSAALSSSQSNVCTFSWAATVETKSKKWFTSIEWQTRLVKNCTITDGSKIEWKSGKTGWGTGTSTNGSGSHTITEDTALLASASYTRWFRVRTRGPEGASAWRYTKHVYAQPNRANVTSVSAVANKATGYNVKVTWTAAQDAAHPIDRTTVQYKIATPAANMACPSAGSWTDANVSADTKGKDAAAFTIDSNLAADQCLWVRVNTIHDSNTNEGIATLAKVGTLTAPTDLNVSINQSTYRATVTATNASAVPDAFLVVYFRQSKTPDKTLIVGIIPAGDSSVTVQCPNWTSDPQVSFGVRAIVGSYTAQTRTDGVRIYTVTAKMNSAAIWDGGSVPIAPTGVTVSSTSTPGTIRVTWNWTWTGASLAEISWADHADAWESTDGPSTYDVDNLNAAAWNISGLELGKTWYVRIRLKKEETFGPYCSTLQIDLSSAPQKPVLVLSQAIVRKGEMFTGYWDYVSSDGTAQGYAELRTATIINGVVVIGTRIAAAQTARSLNCLCPAAWVTGETYLVVARVYSTSGQVSEWSDPVPISVAEPVEVTITQNSLEEVTITTDGESRTVLALTEMPFTITATGAGAGGETIIIIDRAEDYQVDRPDESEVTGFEGETIALISQVGEAQVSIGNDNLIGKLDDGAAYRVYAIAKDGLGQMDEQHIDFEVHWSHQAIIPNANETIRGTAMELEPIAPEGAETGDTCDIYRLSADKPVLIAENVDFGQRYIDPYPAIGDNGGHRFVFKTANGDYITEDNVIAWIDLEDEFDADYSIIDYDGGQVILRYDLSFSNQWQKEFTETKYLGGSVQGDWAPAVSRTTSLSGTMITVEDDDMISALRKLAAHPGVCHVRTPDGSSFDADVQVSESRTYANAGRKVEFSLNMTRVDPEGLDAIPVDVWEG